MCETGFWFRFEDFQTENKGAVILPGRKKVGKSKTEAKKNGRNLAEDTFILPFNLSTSLRPFWA